ncbi:probable metal-nicotianamine transporter YSL17 [Aegilops tauschii subsp. strangulata]|uniref:Metal-nicotianamine transporter YSL7 n=1 Tax=Aegilops tauschii subsp. strangulata TaxID=200361 RepID=A0A453CRW4_AEGTS|nr:probable metal-nicotianamine transporter YSL17 [Aegilops tauschii subsp. strangulata]
MEPSTPPAATHDLWGMEDEQPSTERVFEGESVPSRSETITVRSVAVSIVLGCTLSVVAMKLALTSGFAPSLAMPAGLLGFFIPRLWMQLMDSCEASQLPFTRQENTVIQTCVVACTSIAYSGGFGTYILAMSKHSAEGGVGSDGLNVEEPDIGRMIVFLLLTSFAGILAIMPFRDSLIVHRRLTFPSGTATAHLINTMHTPQGAKQAGQQLAMLLKTLFGTVAWSIFEWFFAGRSGCGFQAFPVFGLGAFRRGFYYDFSMTNVGVGMFCPYKITISMLTGSLVSWGLIWPYIQTKEGDWYPQGLDRDNISGINGYRVFIGVSMILADGLLHMLCILVRTLYAMYKNPQPRQSSNGQPFRCLSVVLDRSASSFDDRRRTQVFLRDRVPATVPVVGYVVLSVISTLVIPQLYTQLRYHHVAFAYIIAPVFAFCNAYGNGMTDMNIATTYGKVSILIFSSWVGLKDGGVVAGLAACAIIVSNVSTASDLMQDHKTGYITLTSPHTITICQVAGTALGCVVNPVIFSIFYSVYNSGAHDDSNSIGPYAKVYRGIAMLAMTEKNGLPKHTMLLCKVFLALALSISVLREVSTHKRWRVLRYIPSTIGMAVAFFVPPTIPVGMALGSAVIYLWGRSDRDDMRLMSPAAACGLICGDGFGSLLSSALTLLKATPPICIMFVARGVNQSLDAFLAAKGMPT